MGGPTAGGDWHVETCVEPPCGYGVPQPELSAAGSGDNPGRVSGWLGTQKNARDKHMRVSSAGPGFLARLPPPRPVFTSGYTMSRHLHYALMSACADATTSLEGAAACVRQHGQSVQKALQYLLYGPTVAERKAARQPNGVFADRTFQRYLQSDAYLIGEDWPRSVIRFPDHNQDANAAADTSATAKNTAAPETAEEAEACARFSIASGQAIDMRSGAPWAPITSSNSASGVGRAQCCSVCLLHAECEAFQLEEPGGFCRLLQRTGSSRGRIPLVPDQYSQVGVLTQGSAPADIFGGDVEGEDGGDADGADSTNSDVQSSRQGADKRGASADEGEAAGGHGSSQNGVDRGGEEENKNKEENKNEEATEATETPNEDSAQHKPAEGDTGEVVDNAEGGGRQISSREAAEIQEGAAGRDGDSANDEHGAVIAAENENAQVPKQGESSQVACSDFSSNMDHQAACEEVTGCVWEKGVYFGGVCSGTPVDPATKEAAAAAAAVAAASADGAPLEAVNAARQAAEQAAEDGAPPNASSAAAAAAQQAVMDGASSTAAEAAGAAAEYASAVGGSRAAIAAASAAAQHAATKSASPAAVAAAGTAAMHAATEGASPAAAEAAGAAAAQAAEAGASPVASAAAGSEAAAVIRAATEGASPAAAGAAAAQAAGAGASPVASASAGSEAATTEAAPGDMGDPSQMDRAAAVAAAARVAIPEEEESELGMNTRCYTPAGSEIPCIDDHEPCGGDGSGRGPEDFDSTCASNQCGWACQDAKGKDLLTQVLGCTSCDGGECKCVSHQLEHFVRRLNEDAVAAEDSTPQRSSV